jgi:hypothetical protein
MDLSASGPIRLGAFFDLVTSAVRTASGVGMVLGAFESLAPPALKRLDLRRTCPGLAILGSAGIRRGNKWTAGQGRPVAESDLR